MLILIIVLATGMAMICFGLCVLLINIANKLRPCDRLTNATRGADVVRIAHPETKGRKPSSEVLSNDAHRS